MNSLEWSGGMERWTGLLEWSTGATEWSTGVGVANFVHLPASNFKLFEALNTAGSHAGNSSTICQGLATNYLGMMDNERSDVGLLTIVSKTWRTLGRLGIVTVAEYLSAIYYVRMEWDSGS